MTMKREEGPFPNYQPQKGSRGVIYIVQDSNEYLRECIFSAKSLKKHHPKLHVTLFTNLRLNKGYSCFDQIIYSDTGLHPFKSKVYHIAASPYEYTLFLDTDTQVLHPIDELYELLENTDMGMAHEPYKSNFEQCKKAKDFSNVKVYNTGLILFKYTPEVYEFFGRWFGAIYTQPDASLNYFNSDQDYFNQLVMGDRALEDLGVRYLSLDNKVYNVRTWIIQPLKEMGIYGNVRLLHHRGLHLHFWEKLWRRLRAILNV